MLRTRSQERQTGASYRDRRIIADLMAGLDGRNEYFLLGATHQEFGEPESRVRDRSILYHLAAVINGADGLLGLSERLLQIS